MSSVGGVNGDSVLLRSFVSIRKLARQGNACTCKSDASVVVPYMGLRRVIRERFRESHIREHGSGVLEMWLIYCSQI